MRGPRRILQSSFMVILLLFSGLLPGAQIAWAQKKKSNRAIDPKIAQMQRIAFAQKIKLPWEDSDQHSEPYAFLMDPAEIQIRGLLAKEFHAADHNDISLIWSATDEIIFQALNDKVYSSGYLQNIREGLQSQLDLARNERTAVLFFPLRNNAEVREVLKPVAELELIRPTALKIFVIGDEEIAEPHWISIQGQTLAGQNFECPFKHFNNHDIHSAQDMAATLKNSLKVQLRKGQLLVLECQAGRIYETPYLLNDPALWPSQWPFHL